MSTMCKKGLTSKPKFLVILFLFFLIFIFFWTRPVIYEKGTIKIWDRNNVLLYESAGEVGRKIPVPFEKFPKHLINAVISSEDISFWQNTGVDFRAIARSLFLNIKAGKIITGASTITQQLARSAVISPGKLAPRSFGRKIREIFVALRLNLSYSKKEILTMYLNKMYFGNLSYGAQAASSTYFNKDVSRLSLSESAFLAALISSPDTRNPYKNFNAAKKRQLEILDLMYKNKFISKEELAGARAEKISIAGKKNNIKSPHFVHFVLQEMENLNIDSSGGINIYTTLDYPTFELSEEIAKSWVSRLSAEHDLNNAALVLIKNDTGEILDMLGGVDYYDSKNSGEVNMTTALRQPGSALKPITYAAAFMKGYTPATLIYDIKKVYKTKKGEGFTPNNYDGKFHGLVLAREALASSLNLPAVEMLSRIGMTPFLKTARDLGITTFKEDDRYDLSITLGGAEVSLLDLTNVYAGFARGGQYKEPFAISEVVSDNGKILFTHNGKSGTQVLGKNGEKIAYLISDILSDAKARIPAFGEKNPLVLSRPSAVKTGTTTDWHDNWTVGYTPGYTAGVWVGNNDNHQMRNITGIVGAAPIWSQFLEEFLKGKPVEKFDRVGGLKNIEVCKLSGKLNDGICPEIINEIFIEGTEPKEISKIHRKIKIDKRNNLLSGKDCSKDFILEKIFIDYPPEVYSWAKTEGLETIPKDYSSICKQDVQGSTNTYLEITNPRNKAVFESAPYLIKNQAVVFEVNVSSDIENVSWYTDGKLFKTSSDFPFSISWPPVLGKHKIKALGETLNGERINSQEVHISVIDYKGDN